MALVIIIQNKTKLAPVSDYDYSVRIGDGTRMGSKIIAEGEVIGHIRDDGWKALAQRVLDQSSE